MATNSKGKKGNPDTTGGGSAFDDAMEASEDTKMQYSAMQDAMESVANYHEDDDRVQRMPDTISLAPETSQTASRFVGLMEQSIRRWERVVYPTLLILFLMFGAAAFLIYELSSDMRIIARGFDPKMADHMSKLTDHMGTLSKNITRIAKHIDTMSSNVNRMTQHTRVISDKMDHLTTMEDLKVEMKQMNQAMAVMTRDMGLMRHNVAGMNHSVGKPMSFISSFMPW